MYVCVCVMFIHMYDVISATLLSKHFAVYTCTCRYLWTELFVHCNLVS